jgi:hypothetical protein
MSSSVTCSCALVYIVAFIFFTLLYLLDVCLVLVLCTYLWFTFRNFCLLLQSPACFSTHSFIKCYTVYSIMCLPCSLSCAPAQLSFLVVTSFALLLIFLVYLCGSWQFLYLQGHVFSWVCGWAGTGGALCRLFSRLFVSKRPSCVFLFWYCILLIILLYSGFLVCTLLFCYLHFWLVFQSHMCSPCGSPSRSPGHTVYWVCLSSVHCYVAILVLFIYFVFVLYA